MLRKEDVILFSGGARGAEAEFGLNAERHDIEEVNFNFEGHQIERNRGLRILNHEELAQGGISLAYVSKLMHRQYPHTEHMRKVFQCIWWQVNKGQEIYVIGKILPDGTVKGGTGWGAEFAKLCNKPLFVFEQEQDQWFRWNRERWDAIDPPRVEHIHFTGTGTRFLQDNARKAIADLFDRSF
jgi:hypothetical protein